MTANKQPIFSAFANFDAVVIGTQNTKSDGSGTIGTDLWLALTIGLSGAGNGSYIDRIEFIPTASVAATTTAATVLRAFVSKQSSGATTSANTFLLGEFAAAAQTADQTTTVVFPIVIPVGAGFDSRWKTILCSTHVANAANTAWIAKVFGGDY